MEQFSYRLAKNKLYKLNGDSKNVKLKIDYSKIQ